MSAEFELRLSSTDEEAVTAVADHARRNSWAQRLMDRDVTLWSDDPNVQRSIADRLGWLDTPAHFSDQIAALEGFGDGIRVAGFRTAVVMGMGGSSLAPEVLLRTFGTAEGYLDLRVLDSTDPAAVAEIVDDLDPLSTLWIVASKSGTTTEPVAFLADAWARVEEALAVAGSSQQPGEFIVAITDPGKSVGSIPHHDELREVFLNPPDIGGRYAALSYVGLVPASLIGLDLDPLLASASMMVAACREPEPQQNPGLLLGITLGVLARAGRDKLTFVMDPDIASFGTWVEQLVAESTGKHGVGIVPVVLEPLGAAESYGADRVFVSLALTDAPEPSHGLLDVLAAAGHPVIRLTIDDPMDLGAEFIRWEVAAAFAGAVLGIDPFDQPNVEEAKELTRQLLATMGSAVGRAGGERAGGEREGGEREGGERAGAERAGAERAGAERAGADAAGAADGAHDPLRPLDIESVGQDVLIEAIRAGLKSGPWTGRYMAIQAFIAPDDAADATFERIRALVRDRTGMATTAGYGPRFLHSTGQLHKGGAATGWFVQFVSAHPLDREIPGWPYTFGGLIDAQAQGDAGAIASHDLPILRLRLGNDRAADLAMLERAFAKALDA